MNPAPTQEKEHNITHLQDWLFASKDKYTDPIHAWTSSLY